MHDMFRVSLRFRNLERDGLNGLRRLSAQVVDYVVA